VVETPYAATTDAEPGQLRDDAETTANIRILDPALVTDTFAQLEQIKQYYDFADHLDVDRYEIDGRTQDTVIAVRELNVNNTGGCQQLVQRHRRLHPRLRRRRGSRQPAHAPTACPSFIESGIPSTGDLGDYEPRIYFGENSPEYSIVGAPEGAPRSSSTTRRVTRTNQNATTTFQGDGGPKLDNFFKQLIFAIKFQSEQIVLSNFVNDESQILYDRDPRERVQKVAPYLTLDSDAYPAVVDEKVVWIVDGYTTSAELPVLRRPVAEHRDRRHLHG
jgi:uncharacterized membrane protein (UPF0182 family)